MAKIKIAGLDGSLRNFGVTILEYDTDTEALDVVAVHLIETQRSKVKTVRASSDNLARSQALNEGVREAIKDCAIAFAEVPSGGKSYDAVLGFGIVIGIYGGLPIPIAEVSPAETKRAAVGTATASKEEIIAWAFEKWPNANWFTTKRKGEIVPTKKNEHVADGAAIGHAGIKTPAFRQVAAILAKSTLKAA